MLLRITRYDIDGNWLESNIVSPEIFDREMQCWQLQESIYDPDLDEMNFIMWDISRPDDELEHAFLFHVVFNGETIIEIVDPKVTFVQIFDFIEQYEKEHGIEFIDSSIHYHPINNHFYLELID